MMFLLIVEWFKALSITDWVIVIISAWCFFGFIATAFHKNSNTGKNVMCALSSLVYGYAAILILDSGYFLKSTQGYILACAAVLLYVLTISFAEEKFSIDYLATGFLGVLIQAGVLAAVALLLCAFFALADSVYKDDVYSPLPYYMIFQFALFASSLILQIIATKYEESKATEQTIKSQTSDETSSSYNSGTNSGAGVSTSPGLNTYMTVCGTNEPVYYKDGKYVDSSGNNVPITHIED